MPLTEGQVFAGYTILRLLGAGGMGEVYLVQHPRLPRHDALKVLPSHLTADSQFRQRFNREADLAARLWHPHIIGIHDRGEFEGQLWISMDYVEGTDAGELLHGRYQLGLPFNEVLEIATAVADALDYAHERGLMHRDVKPANILIANPDSRARRILLADFGIARQLDDAAGLTATNMAVFSAPYSPPEQLMGGHVDGHTDQYALACSVFHLLVGSPPFQDSNPAVVITKHLSAPPPPIGSYRPDLRHLEPVFARALAKQPQSRFPKCMDFVDSLRGQATPQPVPPMPAAPTATPQPLAPTLAQVPPQAPPWSGYQTQMPSHPPGRGSGSRAKIVIASVVGALVAVVALVGGVVLIAGNQSDTAAMSTSTPTTTRTSPTTTSATATTSPGPLGGNETIATYIKNNGITETPIHRGDPGAPTLNLPIPSGWASGGTKTPQWAYDSIVYTGSQSGSYNPSIIALMSKLTGNVDAQKLIQLAPGELKNLPGYKPVNNGANSTLSGYPAYQLGGTWNDNGTTKVVAQKTVVVQRGDSVYVVQMNADGLENQLDIVSAATDEIDAKATIT